MTAQKIPKSELDDVITHSGDQNITSPNAGLTSTEDTIFAEQVREAAPEVLTKWSGLLGCSGNVFTLQYIEEATDSHMYNVRVWHDNTMFILKVPEGGDVKAELSKALGDKLREHDHYRARLEEGERLKNDR